MKRFACGDVVPGCDASWVGTTDDDILSQVAAHATSDHGLEEIPAALISAVRARIVAA